MSPSNRETNSFPEDDRFAAELVRIDESIGSGSSDQSASSGEEAKRQNREYDSQLREAADVLRMMRRVRHFEEQMVGEQTSSGGSETRRDTSPLTTSRTKAAAGDAESSQRPPGMPSVPDVIGRFRIIRWLGGGGFGLVFLARDTMLDRRVAIKLPRPEVLAASNMAERFLREGRAAAALNHPNIVPVYEVGELGAVGYIASAYCPGPNLGEWLSQHGKVVESRAAASLVARLADAAEHAHRRGILHRDLKPANILLEHLPLEKHDDAVDRDRDAVDRDEIEPVADWQPLTEFELALHARISDFGLAKLDHSEPLTQTTSTLGTPSYMPPEQADPSAGPSGPPTDVYALGAILYELLVGRPPFQEATILATLDAVRHRQPRPPRQIVAGIPPDLEAITLKCLEKRPAHRYQSAAELADDLERFLGHQMVRARRIHSGERFVRWCRRNPVIAGLAAAVVLLAIGSTVASARLSVAQKETREALADAMQANNQAIQNEYAAQVALADSLLRTNTPGRRVASLRALRRASDLGQQIGIDSSQRLRLRNAVIEGLSKVDLVLEEHWPVSVVGESFLATDPDCQLYAQVDDAQREVQVRRILDNSVHSSWKLNRQFTRLIGMRFSPDGSRLGTRYEAARGRERLQVWDLSTGKQLADLAVGGFGRAADFSPDGRSMAMISQGSRTIEVRSLPSFSVEKTFTRNDRAQNLALAPTGNALAVHCEERIELFGLEDEQLMGSLSCPSYAYVLEFSPDGRQLAAACRDGRIRLYDLTAVTADETRSPSEVLEGHTAMVVNLSWHPIEPILASCSMDGKTRLWDLRSSQSLLQCDQKCTGFSRDGTWLGVEGGRMRLECSRSHRSFRQSDSKVFTPVDLGFYRRGDVTSEIDYWVTLPGSPLVVGQNYFRAVFRDAANDTALADVAVPGCWFRFDQQGRWLYASSQSIGLCRLPVRQRESADEVLVEIGPPELVHSARGGAFALAGDRMVLTPFLSQGYVFPVSTKPNWQTLSRLAVHPYTFWCDISPDGLLVATGSMKGQDVRIFDASSGKQLRTLTSETAAPWFSPDGRMLAVAENARFTFFDTESWQPVHQIETIAGGIWPGSLAFSDDGALIAVESGSEIQLLTSGFAPIATFRVPSTELVESIRFTGDGRYLVSGGGDQHRTHVWDVTTIRNQLRQFELDWNSDGALSDPQTTKPIRLKLDLGIIDDIDNVPSFPRSSRAEP